MNKNIWIEVYRDTIERHDKDWNLSDILVSREFAEQYYNECITTDEDNLYETFEEFLSEYTCDDTEDFYEYAKHHNAIIELEHME